MFSFDTAKANASLIKAKQLTMIITKCIIMHTVLYITILVDLQPVFFLRALTLINFFMKVLYITSLVDLLQVFFLRALKFINFLCNA